MRCLNDLTNIHINAIKQSSQAYTNTKQMILDDVDLSITFISIITNEDSKCNHRK